MKDMPIDVAWNLCQREIIKVVRVRNWLRVGIPGTLCDWLAEHTNICDLYPGYEDEPCVGCPIYDGRWEKELLGRPGERSITTWDMILR